MMRIWLVAAALAAGALSAHAAAPEGAKLSEIIGKIEQAPDVAYVDEVEWSGRRGDYKVEYFLKNGAKVKVRIDPKTGNPVR